MSLGVRLEGGRDESEGRIEVKIGRDWGTVCDDDWDDVDANVTCRQLGYMGRYEHTNLRMNPLFSHQKEHIGL